MTRFWAKTRTADDDFLPVLDHLLDTGEVAARLFDVSLTARQREWIAAAFGVDLECARALVGFLAAAHDIGKIGPFQHLVPELAARLGTDGLPGFVLERCGHDRVSGVVLHRYVTERGGSRELATACSVMVGGHHSMPTAIRNAERRRRLRELERWWPFQQECLDKVADAFAVRSFAGVTTPGDAVTLLLAGLVNVADWNASDAGRFPVTAGGRPPAAELAAAAIDPRVWEPAPPSVGATFEETFGFRPRATQAVVVRGLAELEPPALVLIEDRTGSGKTEAALWAVRWALSRGARGFYVGLPTRATALQFHRRATTFGERVWPDSPRPPRLLHGGVHADAGDAEPTAVGEDGGDAELAAARAWFDGTRRGLLSPYAVGTVDQALLAVLAARFYPVRLWGLAGKVVVVDEAHAYDDYTGELLETTLAWLGALGCTAVVLSATLPAERRAALSDAYRRGVIGEAGAGDADLPATAGYPRVTFVDRKGANVIAVRDDRPGRRFGVAVQRCADDSAEVARAAAAEAADGGCVAVLCSTVALAQERFTVFRERFPDVPALLLHARLRPLERAPVERSVVARLGPAAGAARPAQLVVFATQIIEQSLDLDFDVMLSDLAPIDLLIQRAGRVHRHSRRDRPARHRDPRLVVLDTDGGDVVDRPLPRGAGAVYVNAVLTRTRAVLRGRSAIDEPGDLDELIGAVYGSEIPAGLAPHEADAVRRQDARAAEQARRHRAWARENGIGRPHQEDPPWVTVRNSIEDGEAPGAGPTHAAVTRWSERPSVDVVVLREDEAHLATEPLTRSTVRELLLRAVSISDPRVTGPLLGDLDAHRPSSWRRHGALRHHALVTVGTFGIGWQPELGVML